VFGYNNPGRIFLILGAVFLIIGFLLSFGGIPPWLGNLPGDIRIERENFSFYFPITTMIIISLLFNLLFRLINYFGQ